jgi:isopentenyl phosphate kinase
MQTIFLKLGGSLITEKHHAFTANHHRLKSLAVEIRESFGDGTSTHLVLAHGSGSFGHQAAKQYGTRNGVQTPADWLGFLEVWKQARALNQIVMDVFSEAGLPVISFPPVSAVLSHDRKIVSWDTAPIQTALSHHLIPVIYGDVIFDQHLNGTILSTEELFFGLANQITPNIILIAGIEEGVWQDFPDCTKLVEKITPQELALREAVISGSNAVDVTGGMAEKVHQMVNLVQFHPEIQVQIFSGVQPGSIQSALNGAHLGTVIHN